MTPTRKEIYQFPEGLKLDVSTSYSGRRKTLYIIGKGAKDAELALLKRFPGIAIKTESHETKPVQEAKVYYFNAKGEFFHSQNTTGIVFTCRAMNSTNARRKFGNYVQSLTAKS